MSVLKPGTKVLKHSPPGQGRREKCDDNTTLVTAAERNRKENCKIVF